jgi:hypothetical protein
MIQKKNEKEVTFRRLYGVNRETFDQMQSILQKEFDKSRKRGGNPPKLIIEDKLKMTLSYCREYRTLWSIGDAYRVSAATAGKTIQWVKDVLIRDKTFKLPGKKALTGTPQEIQHVVVDVVERPLPRPPKIGRQSSTE